MCPPVRPLVHPSVRPSVIMSVRPMFEKVRKCQFQALPLTSFNSQGKWLSGASSISRRGCVSPSVRKSIHLSVRLSKCLSVPCLKKGEMPISTIAFNSQGIFKNGYQEHLASQEEAVSAPPSVFPSVCLSICPNDCPNV